MTLNTDFSDALISLFDPGSGLGEVVTLGSTQINALVRYETDADETNASFEVMDIDILRKDYDAVPNYRETAVVDGNTWYFYKQMAGDTISRRLRFMRDARSKFAGGHG